MCALYCGLERMTLSVTVTAIVGIVFTVSDDPEITFVMIEIGSSFLHILGQIISVAVFGDYRNCSNYHQINRY